MAANRYDFKTRWRLRATVEEVHRVLEDPHDLPRWWPSVYLAVSELAPGGKDQIGREIELFTKGWLPYTLRWTFKVTENNGRRLALEARGDFAGRGVWTFDQDGEWVNVVYDWDIAAQKPLLRRLSFILKPVFAANHHWAMRQGEKSLQLELARRRAETPAARRAIPAPPGPTFRRG